MDISTALREARERRGITLGEISRATNISRRVLEAIDKGDLEQVPRGLFARAYLRVYATQVGLNPDDVLTEYLAQHETTPDDELRALRARCAARGASRDGLKIWIVAAALALIACSAFFSGSGDARGDEPIVEAAQGLRLEP